MKNKYYVCVLSKKFKADQNCLKIQQETFRVFPSIATICWIFNNLAIQQLSEYPGYKLMPNIIYKLIKT